jgi:hypothetical protein
MKYFIYTIISIVTIAVIAGFFVVGSPQEERLRRFDEQRVGHLQTIQWEIVNYWQSKEKLPESLEELNDPIRGFIAQHDPHTGESYEYALKGPLTFELCATFARPSPAAREAVPIAKPFPDGPHGGIEENWQHGEGRTCFERTIDPDFYPPRSKLER